MYNVTETFHTEAFSASREITVRATFNDTVEIDGNHLKDMTIEEIVSADNLSIGSTCSSKATVNMFMPEEAIPLSNGWMNLYVGIPTECPLGKYYISDVVTKDKYKTVTITAYDKMWHLNKSYVPGANMTFPATVSAVVMDIAEQNDFEVDFDSFPDYEIPLVEATEREMIGYCAGLMGKNAKFNRDGKLTFVWFTDTDRDIPLEAQYQGGFSETTADSFVLGGLVSGTEENPLTAGSGRTITFSNPFMTQEILDGILSEVAGFTYTPCEVKYRCDPSFETGDIVDVVDDDSDVTAVYPVPIMAQKIKVGGGLNATIYAYGKSEESEILIKAPSDGKIERAKKEVEEYLGRITDNIVGKNGGYYRITYDELGFPNGWEIRNTPTLTTETKLWRMSAGGLGFSGDGGKTFSKLAFDLDGNFYAECIKSGSIGADKLDVEDLFAQDITSTGDFKLGGNGALEYDSETDELSIRVKSLQIGLSEVPTKDEMEEAIDDSRADVVVDIYNEYATSGSYNEEPTEGWSADCPAAEDGVYIWSRQVSVYGNGDTETKDAVCITGAKGEDATLLRIESSRGTVFKNNMVSTTLSAVIYKGSKRITDIEALREEFGLSAHLEWKWQHMGDETYKVILSTDSRIGNGGFTFTLSPEDVDTKVVFMCQLITD